MVTLRRLRRRIADRGGLCSIWLVYEEDRQETIAQGRFRPLLVRGFWERAEAIAWARARHAARPARHYHVYRVTADEQWVAANEPRRIAYVASFEDSGERPPMAVTAGAVAHALEGA